VTIIRNFRGSWPNWVADLDDGHFVFIYIRYGEVRIGRGPTVDEASEAAIEVENKWDLGGVSNCLDALVALQANGYYYVAPNES